MESARSRHAAPWQRGIAQVVHRVHVRAELDAQRDRPQGLALRRARDAGRVPHAGRHHERRRAVVGGDQGIGAVRDQLAHHVDVVGLGRDQERRRALHVAEVALHLDAEAGGAARYLASGSAPWSSSSADRARSRSGACMPAERCSTGCPRPPRSRGRSARCPTRPPPSAEGCSPDRRSGPRRWLEEELDVRRRGPEWWRSTSGVVPSSCWTPRSRPHPASSRASGHGSRWASRAASEEQRGVAGRRSGRRRWRRGLDQGLARRRCMPLPGRPHERGLAVRSASARVHVGAGRSTSAVDGVAGRARARAGHQGRLAVRLGGERRRRRPASRRPTIFGAGVRCRRG